MTELRIVGISGNLTRPSKTRALVGEILRQAESFGAGRTELYDLVDAGPELGAAVQRESAAKAPDRVLSAIENADALVVASPIFKASYTGLFKHLFDLIEPKMLEGRPVLLAATGGSDRHALVIEHQLRPLFAFFRANVLPIGLYATNGDFGADGALSDAMVGRITPVAEQFAVWLVGSARIRARGATLVRVA
jgi:FMN reductase